jgi:hypothetical protein
VTSQNERGDIIVGWLTKVAVVLVLFGVTGFDAISVMTTKVSASDDANQAAREGAEAWSASHGDVQKAYDAAEKYAEKHNATVDPHSFVIDADGTVRLRLEKTATTLLVYRTGKTKGWAHVAANGSGRAV